MQVYLVGGAVRDTLLNREVTERDWVVVGATPEQLSHLGYQQVGKDFPVFLHPDSKEEYALARTERKQGSGYHGFACYFDSDVTLEQDLIRRDLTVNAMAMTEDGAVIDPYNGRKDLANRILRHVSDAFIEDPLRVLRVARFAARYHTLGFTVAEETLQLMRKMATSGELSDITPERVWQEINKALSEESPHIFFSILHDCGALVCFMPELDALWGIPNPAKWHPEIDSGIHTMMVLEQAAKLTTSTMTRFAALCHDLGKALTEKALLPSHHGHEKAGVDIIKKVAARLKIPNSYKKLAMITSEFHLHCHRALELNPKTLVKVLEKAQAYRQEELFLQFLLACEADFKGRTGFEHKDYPQRRLFQDILAKTRKVDATLFTEQGLTGQQIGQHIHRYRVELAKQIQQKYQGMNYESNH
ncbi:MAG: multifunctional CCA addition/repair protein [Kangiellaceae bacterium]|jgi:tRNA nucleotidyltransferase (CCA-adding enzyme)|nr:multifunctional CCA addition/repair protein [Kangiellaceae bacterium]